MESIDNESIIRVINNLRLDPSELTGQEADQQVVNWYADRFAMLKEDGCTEAISAYLKKLSRSDCNELTRALVMKKATEAMCS